MIANTQVSLAEKQGGLCYFVLFLINLGGGLFWGTLQGWGVDKEGLGGL